MPHHAPDTNTDPAMIWQCIRHIRIARLATQEGNGVSVRPMTTVQPSYDGILWFFADVEGKPADEVRRHPRVAVSYSDSSDGLFVTLHGEATVVRDRASIASLMTPQVKTWFPEGEQDGRIALIAIKVDDINLYRTGGQEPKL